MIAYTSDPAVYVAAAGPTANAGHLEVKRRFRTATYCWKDDCLCIAGQSP